MRLVAALFAMVIGTAAHADNESGNFLMEVCDRDTNYSIGRCDGLIQGAYHGIISGAFFMTYETDYAVSYELMSEDALQICIPSSVTTVQAIDVVKLYLTTNPKDRHLPYSMLVFGALKDAYSCN